MKKYPSLSVCMIVKDEEKNLPTALSSVKGLADEIVVVDTGSKDGTVAIAKSFGAGVHHFAWCDDFSAARNESLKHATKDFVLWLDADDEIRREDHRKIKDHLRKHPGCGVYLRTHVEGEGHTPQTRLFASQLRLFPNHRGIRFEGKVHEQAVRSLETKGILIHQCSAAVVHHGYEEPGVALKKLRRNRLSLEMELKEHPEDLNTLFFLSRTCQGLGEQEAALAYLDAIIARGEDPVARSQTVFNLAILDKGSLLSLQGRREEALSVLLHGKSLFPEFALLRYFLGKLHFERKEYKEAFLELLPLRDETFERELTPINVPEMKKWLYRGLGVSALFMNDFGVAEQCFASAAATEPDDASAYHYLSLTRERKGDAPGAIEACRLGLARLGANDYLKKRLFLLLADTDDFGPAVDLFETLNGHRTDLDVISGRFLIASRMLDAPAILRYYGMLQEKLSLPVGNFPENLQETREKISALPDERCRGFFEAAISFLFAQAQ